MPFVFKSLIFISILINYYSTLCAKVIYLLWACVNVAPSIENMPREGSDSDCADAQVERRGHSPM